MRNLFKASVVLLLAVVAVLVVTHLTAGGELTSLLALPVAAPFTLAAIRIKPIESLKAKFKSNTAGAGPAYEEGVKFPKRSPTQTAAASADLWQQSVASDDAKNSFSANVLEAGDTKWAKEAVEIGKGRYTVAAPRAADEWGKGAAPILAAIAAVDLPPRGPKNSEENFARVRAVANAASQAAG